MSTDLTGPRPCIVARSRLRIRAGALAASMLAFALTTNFTHAQIASVTERAAIDMALARPAYRIGEDGRIAVAESAVTQAGLPPNPNVGFEHERGSAAGGRANESTLQVSQAFDFAGRRALHREAAEQRLEAAQYDRATARNRVIAEVRNAFADALYRDRVRSGLRGWGERIDAAYSVVAQLARAGEASGYERRRLERERQAAHARLARAEADYGRARELLAGLIGSAGPHPVTPAGDLIPPEAPPLSVAQAGMRARPELQSLVAQAEAFDRDRRAAGRVWLSEVTLGVGAKRVDEPARSDNAIIASLSIAIPVFDRGQAAQKRASAEASITRAEHALRLERWAAEVRGVWAQASDLRRAAVAFGNETAASSRDLSRIAEAAYRGGEASLLELLDAYRSELEAETTALDLALAARVARIELDLLSGAQTNE